MERPISPIIEPSRPGNLTLASHQGSSPHHASTSQLTATACAYAYNKIINSSYWMVGSDYPSLQTHNNKQYHHFTTMEEHRFCQSASNPTQVWSFKVLWSPNLCTTTHQLQVAGQSHPTFGSIPGVHSPSSTFISAAWTMVTHYPAGPVASTSFISQVHHLLGVAAFFGYRVQHGWKRMILMTTRVRVALCYWRIWHILLEQVVHLPSNVKQSMSKWTRQHHRTKERP